MCIRDSYVVVINCDQAVLTGKKAEQKFHITHSKYIGGLKKVCLLLHI